MLPRVSLLGAEPIVASEGVVFVPSAAPPWRWPLSPALAHQSLLALMLSSDVPLLGEHGSGPEQSPW